ncbi:MAG: bile acid:sodium symporter family protein [Steroidobacteraceae bacterium]
MFANLKRFLPDGYVVAIICTVVLASLLPCRGQVAQGFDIVTDALITLLFFLHGAKLSREAIVQGLGHWRLHLLVLCATFCFFPILGLATKAATAPFLDPSLVAGLLFLTLLPSTVQSSIAFTAVANGNVAAAVCSASASNFLGIFITPLLVNLLMPEVSGGAEGGDALEQIKAICLKLLLPFVLGHLSRPLTAGWISKRKQLVGLVDRGSILFVVYTAFSAAVVEGLWTRLSLGDLLGVLGVCVVMLAIVLAATTFAARAFGFPREDEAVIVFCGSKKSLASGVPMAGVLFPAAVVGPIIVPLMLFHQIQLMACAVLARRYAARSE